MDEEFLRAIRKGREDVFIPRDDYPVAPISQVSDETKSEALTISLNKSNFTTFSLLLEHNAKPREKDSLFAIRTPSISEHSEIAFDLIPLSDPEYFGQALLAALKL